MNRLMEKDVDPALLVAYINKQGEEFKGSEKTPVH